MDISLVNGMIMLQTLEVQVRKGQLTVRSSSCTLLKFNMEPENGTLE